MEFIADTEAAVQHSEAEINHFTLIILLPQKAESQFLHFPLEGKSHEQQSLGDGMPHKVSNTRSSSAQEASEAVVGTRLGNEGITPGLRVL